LSYIELVVEIYAHAVLNNYDKNYSVILFGFAFCRNWKGKSTSHYGCRNKQERGALWKYYFSRSLL